MTYNNCKTIDIFGSCISRDALEFCPKSNIACGQYIARSSFSSAVASPPATDLEMQEIDLGSNFQARSIVQDVNKTGLKKLRSDPGDYLLVDFFEERFPIAQAKGTMITLSSEYLKSGLDYSNKIVWRNLNEMAHQTTFLELFDRFTDAISGIYPTERIILHKAFLCNEYISNDGSILSFSDDVVAWNNSINDKLRALYDRFEMNLPACRSIDLCRYFIGSASNKWGLASTHYQEEYYAHAAKAIGNIVIHKPKLPLFKVSAALIHFNRNQSLSRLSKVHVR